MQIMTDCLCEEDEMCKQLKQAFTEYEGGRKGQQLDDDEGTITKTHANAHTAIIPYNTQSSIHNTQC